MQVQNHTDQNFTNYLKPEDDKKSSGQKTGFNYYPFGLKHTGYNNYPAENIYSNSYKYQYNGKEFQNELSLNVYDYGQRAYDPAIGRFNRLDRFSEKYYGLSPYNYTANNPVRFIDIKGDSLWINHRGNEILYQDGRVSNSDGSTYLGKGVKVKKDGTPKLKGFLKKAVNALNTLSSETVGNSIVDELQGSSSNYTIVRSNTGNRYNRGRNEIQFDPSSKHGGINEKDKTGRPTFISLGHEIGHAIDDDRGTRVRGTDPAFGFRNSEKFGSHIENQLRSEHNIPLRTHYGIDANGNGVGRLISAGTKPWIKTFRNQGS